MTCMTPISIRSAGKIALAMSFACAVPHAGAQQPAGTAAAADPVAVLVSQLDLEKYKATIKSLTRFGDRRQGTERNRQAVSYTHLTLPTILLV